METGIHPDTTRSARRPSGSDLVLAAALLGAVVLAFWLVGPLSLRGTATREPEGYYGLLTEAFLRGHTYLSIQPDPALAALPNPWAGYQGVPRLHDATYFHGRYYLYFGPTPAIILGVPWRLLTGTYLSDGAMTFVFTAAGALLGGGLLLGAWRRWFFPLSRVWLAAALLAVTCSGYVFCLVESNAVYPVPIACAYACLMAALAGIALVLRRPTGPAAALGLGAASLCWGLAVAARPDYAFSLPVLALPVAYAAKESTRLGRARFRGAAAVLCAGVLPALLVGVAVALYNFARFGDLMEFGWKYQFASVDQRFTRLLALGHLADNWRGYLLATPLYSPYFPFVLENEGAWGILRCCPLALAALAFPLTLGVPALRRDPSWLWLGVAALAAALLNFFSLGLLSIAAERYLVDAVPLALWLGVMVTLGFLQHTCRSPQWLVRLGAATAAALLLGCTLVHTVLFAFDHYGRPERLAPLARLLDQPAAAWERMRGIRHGPIEMKVQFGQIQPGRNDPLLVTGGGRDVLLATYPSDHEVQFSFQHAGDGGPVSDRFPIKPGETHLLEADLGSLYPPNEHPFFRGWPDHLVDRLRHRVWVVFDGHQALDTGSRFYRTNPWDLHLGFNPYGWATAPRFSGRIVQIEQTARLAEQPPAVPPGQGAVRLTVRLPAFRAFHSEPLISTGIPGAGDLLYVTYVGPGQLRFAHDHWGAGAVESPAAPYDANALHVVDVDMASLHPGVGSGNRTGLLAVRFDGRLLLDQDRPFYASDPGDVVVGFNNTASTAAVSIFSGQIARVDRVASALASQQPRTPGALRLQLRLPVDRPGRSEPLVVTGRTGAGDGVFVRYLDHNHVSFGYDHWGVGGAVTPPVEVDYGAILDLEIGLASLYPPAGDPDWAGVAEATKQAAMTRIWVTLDGRTVFSATAKSYPAPADEVFVGRNPIGLSTCDPDFSGAILIQERLPIGIPPAAP